MSFSLISLEDFLATIEENRTDAEREFHAEIRARIHANLPVPSEQDSVDSVRAMRDEDIRATEAKWDRIEADLATKTDEEMPANGRKLLDFLGL